MSAHGISEVGTDSHVVQAFEAEMASFYHLFNRFLAEKAKGERLYV